ncbi:MAG: DEAD/DEAH box helicase family protein, partial [Clostridia bacterium]|nr:DEAD/DEAH box helicase family protein [Clostridia bacterium]
MKFNPHEYQKTAIKHIIDHPAAALLLDMGLGKTVITLTAILYLMKMKMIRKLLVIAPLRVAKNTWPTEIRKWDHLAGLSYRVVVGNERERRAALSQTAEITIVNRESLPWLIEKSGMAF